MPPSDAFDLTKTYLELADGGRGTEIEVTESFWPDLIAGRRKLEGRLMICSNVTGDVPHWEMHPAGEEVILLQSGAVDFILEEDGGERRVALRPETPCLVVPRGVWHRFETVEPGRLVFITYGEGTQHRPR